MVVLMSIFRDMASRLPQFFRQVSDLNAAIEAPMRLVLVEGDSKDGTYEQLKQMSEYLDLPATVIQRAHGGPYLGSVDHPVRMKQLGYVVNGGLDEIKDTDDAVIYVESDLHWQPKALISCLRQLQPGVDIISPPVFTTSGAFYDIWGYRTLEGWNVGPLPPYYNLLKTDGLTELATVGSCLVMRAEVARRARLNDTQALVGFCHDARSLGYRVYTDWRERIVHP